MRKKSKPADLKKVRTYSIRARKSKFKASQQAQCPDPSRPLAEFFNTLPQVLKAQDLLTVANRTVEASKKDRLVLFLMGAHLIKCGLSPLLCDLIRRGIVNAVAMNGASAIHDFELAFFGKTSEDVEKRLADGTFGMAQETAEWMNTTISEGVQRGYGLGESLGMAISRTQPPFAADSILATACEMRIPATVHVAIGTDIIHQHASLDPAALGKGTHLDFRLLAGQLPDLGDGGVVINFGSAVIMPEVFLKALTVARNLGAPVTNFTAANFDMIQHYRPNVNVLQRPTKSGGEYYSFTGHHEIMLPLFYSAVRALI
ncbi:MAG TPA: hypothetical protein PLB62_14090 [Candidatus Sumerlaeota bacterium]|nr:hypothetical protein [Candidatus Sumerlaeota bacterium]